MNSINIPKKTIFVFNSIKALFFALIRKLVGYQRFHRKKYNGKPIIKCQQANYLIKRMIEAGKPFLIARFGDGELRTSVHFLEKKERIRAKYPKYIKLAICNNAGFFPNDEKMIDRFSDLLLSSTKEVDVLAVWFNYLEDYVYKVYGPVDGKCITLRDLEPFWFDEPWSQALSGKKVLVIHPFSETIKTQYERRTKLFSNRGVLPSFKLITLKSVQSIGGKSDSYNNWFEALEDMYKKAVQIDFDIAIIGCGAYGLPLGAKLKKIGKMVIHLGGVTQFLFGIKGKRWDEKPEYSHFYNEYWVRPGESDRPKEAGSVENGCYW